MRRWLDAGLDSRWMLPTLGLASFLESILIPIPLEAILIPLMQARRDRLWWLAGVALIGCVCGAIVGYFVGVAFMESVGQQAVEYFGAQETYQDAKDRMVDGGFWFVMSVSLVPVPFQIAMLAAGAAGYSFALFMLATMISRGIRYFGLAVLVYFVGDHALALYRKHKIPVTTIVVVAIVAAWGIAWWVG